MLQKKKLLDYSKNGISIGPEYKTVFNEFVSFEELFPISFTKLLNESAS